MVDETLIYFGDSVKALGDGRVGGYLVLYGDENHTDASSMKDYFTSETDFSLDVSDKSPVLYHHSLDKTLGNRKLGVGALKADEVGVWIEAQLNLRDEYEKKIYQAVENKKMGWSSGTASHLIRRERQANGSHKILAWPLGLDASITPTPAEPRTMAVSLKSLIEVDEPSLKGKHLGEHAEKSALMAGLSQLNAIKDMAVCEHIYDENRSHNARMADIRGAFNEYRDMSLKLIDSALAPEPEESEMKALIHDAVQRLHAGQRFASHSEMVLGAVEGFVGRVESYAAMKAKDGKPMSSERRAQFIQLRDRLDEVIKATKPVTDEQINALKLLYLRTQFLEGK